MNRLGETAMFSVGAFKLNQKKTHHFLYRKSSFKEDDGTWRGNEDGKVVNNQPQRVMDDRNGVIQTAGYIGRYVFIVTNVVHTLYIPIHPLMDRYMSMSMSILNARFVLLSL